MTDTRGGAAYWTREAAELALLLAALAVASAFVRIPLWLLIALPAGKVLTSVAFFALFLRRVLGRPARSGAESLVGRTAVAATPMHPTGRIRLNGESWAARNVEDRIIAARETVQIVGIRPDGTFLVRSSECWNSSEAS